LETRPGIDFGELAVRLAAFGLRTLAEFGLCGPEATVTGVGLSVEDFAWTVLSEYAEGKLEHHSDRGDLFALLATALRNDIVDALRRAAHSHEEARSSLPRERNAEKEPPALDEFPADAQGIEADLDEKQYRKRVHAAVADEPDLTQVVQVVLDLNLYKPREIAEALGISASEVQNRKKRLRRRLIERNLVKGISHEQKPEP
jgi:RNA polymerase sigma factor (sigma-70 family)